MATYEFEGKTAQEAIENASRELNIPVEELDVDIIDPGSAGIFGLVGSKKAKIRVTIKDREEKELEGIINKAKETLKTIISLIQVEATIKCETNDNTISLMIEGDRSGLLIGKKGRTLDALQFIVNKIVNKGTDKKIRVIIDSENYRKRRIDSLIQLARKMGERAKKTKKVVMTNPLNSRDRRIVHLALKNDASVDTKSKGKGPLKKVMIIPHK